MIHIGNAIIIPTLEPDNHIIKLVKELKKLGATKIVIIDDGSGDKYKSIFEELENLECFVFHHEQNLGKGEAIKTGIKHANELFDNITGYVTADGDGQHAPKDIMKVSTELEKHKCTIILGTRDFSKKNVPFKSYYGNKFSSMFFKLDTGITCNDTQTGLRGITIDLTGFALSTPGSRYEYEMNFLITAAKRKINVINVPIETIYENNNKASHFKPFEDSIRIYKTPLKFITSSLFSAVFDLTMFTILVHSIFIGNYGIMLATIFARIMSGILNFSLNKRWSFKSDNNSKVEVFKYSVLFVFQMLASAVLVSLFAFIPIFITVIKIIIDALLSAFSYYVQRNYIFDEGEMAI